MERFDITSEVIRSRCRKRCKCYLCNKGKTEPFIEPSEKVVRNIYNATQSMEIFKMIKVFWLCDEHYRMFQEREENGYKDDDAINRLIESTCDLGLLDQIERILVEMIEAESNARRYARIVRKEIANPARN